MSNYDLFMEEMSCPNTGRFIRPQNYKPFYHKESDSKTTAWAQTSNLVNINNAKPWLGGMF